MVYSILDRGIQFFQEPKNRHRIQEHFVDPLVKYILDRMFPYIILTCILFSMILLLSIISVGILMFQLHNAAKMSALSESITKTIAIINE